jgi:hypothetical protein
MSDDRVDEVKKNILSPSQWVRILYMVFYAVACWVLLFVVPIIIVCQVLIALITGVDNRDLRDFGAKLSAYFHSALDYLLYVNDEKPWPFVSEDDDDLDDESDDLSSEAKAAADNQQQSGDEVYADISFTENAAGNTHGDEADEHNVDFSSNDEAEQTSGEDSQASGEDSQNNESDDDKKDPA